MITIAKPYRLAISVVLIGGCLIMGNYNGAFWFFVGLSVWSFNVEFRR